MKTGNEIVDTIGSLHYSGNIIPMEWYKLITFPNGKPDVVSITLLADLIYWYRPYAVRDEASGEVIEYRKKFDADMLQRSSRAYSETFGFTLRQVQDSLKRLQDQNFILREFRTITTKTGIVLNNIQFIGPIPESVSRLCNLAIQRKRIPSYDRTQTLPRSNASPPPIERTPSPVETQDIVHDSSTVISAENSEGEGANAPPAPLSAYTPINETDLDVMENPHKQARAAVATAKQRAEKKTSHKPTDDRAQHPAILAVRELIELNPSKILWDDIIALVGESPDKEKLRACFKLWSMKSTNKARLEVWLFDWFKNGIPNGNGAASYQPAAWQGGGR